MITNNCGECKHMAEYANGPLCFCELIYDLFEKECEVNPNIVSDKCPFKNWNFVQGCRELKESINE